MTHVPTGRLFRTGSGTDLVLSRTFRAPIEDVWASVTESDRTARWFGPWEGDAAPGRTIKVQMAFEEGAPWSDMRIDACEAPNRLAMSASAGEETWHLELLLAHVDGATELRLVQHLEKTDGIGEVGPGWEYYLDLLVASREEHPTTRPEFADYYPAQKEYFEGL
jgi:uncharacterized protein YndB with AHSA1/START domain